jgi:amino acid adenylation domain-containing protein
MARLDPAQQGIWFTEVAGVAGTTYHLGVLVEFSDGLDRDALDRACLAVQERHPALRARLAPDDGQGPRLTVDDDPHPPRRVAGRACLDAELAAPLGMDGGPLARFVLADAGATALLLVAVHHLVFDGMSKDVLVADLASAYNAAVAGQTARLPGSGAPPATGPAVSGAERDAAREFWRPRWRRPRPPVLPGLSRVPTAAEPGCEVPFEIRGSTSTALDAVAAELGATRFEIIVAALHALLTRYGTADPVIGVDLSTRPPGAAAEIGLYANELPLAVPAAPRSFRELVGEVRAALRELYRHRTIPLGHAVTGLRPAPAVAPVSVSYRRRSAVPTFDGVTTAVDWLVFDGSARNAAHLALVDAPDGGLSGSLRFAPAALDPDAGRRLAAHLRTLLASALDDPDTAVEDLDLLTGDELDLLVRRLNDTDRPRPHDATAPALLAARAADHPGRTALVAGGRAYDYRWLATRCEALAALLRARGAGPGTLVAVCLPRAPALLVALLAVMRCGAGAVPVDPAHPSARRALILDEARPALVIAGAPPAAGDHGAPVLVLDDAALDSLVADLDGLVPGRVPTSPAACATPGPDDTAYVMFTSGSTGRPKGVVIGHRALANLLAAMAESLGASPDDRWLALTSVAFDISLVELLVPLTTGGRVVLAERTGGRHAAGTLDLMARQGVTHVQATPSGWQLLLAAGFGRTARVRVTAVVGGEALPLPLARDLRGRVDRLVNVYGPTETTIWSTLAEVGEHVTEVTIGRPLANTRAYVLDGRRRPVPQGVTGELYLGGTGVADGYLGRPELTAERFLPDPFRPSGRLYRTGDLVRVRADGELVFAGRTDDQVKIRGHRVEPGEIESVLLEHGDVAWAAVVADPDEDAPRLLGYVVPRGDGVDVEDLRRHLARSLPAVMIPGAWTVLEDLPLTPNGKLDRSALPPPAEHRPPGAGGAVKGGAADAVLDAVRQIWSDVLQVEDITPDDDLFDLGGHSLSVARIAGRIEEDCGVQLGLDVFFETPTLAEVSAAVGRRLAEEIEETAL